MTIALGVTGIVVAGVFLMLFMRRQLARKRHPQDFAFAVCTTFGSGLRLPRETRIRRVFPLLADDVLAAWLKDFERVDTEIDRLARAGGRQRLGNKVVEDSLRQLFPFLVGPGLQQAVFLVGYVAMHEGYDESPDPSVGKPFQP